MDLKPKGNILKYKLVFIGDQSVGKTSIINRFIYDTFTGMDEPTVGIDFISKTLHVDNKTVRLQLWDTAGQEKFKSLIPSYVRDSDGVIIIYDITNQKSFENIEKWASYVQEERGNDVLIFLVGNKTDDQENRKISSEDGLEQAKKMSFQFQEVSAKSGDNIQNLFKEITNKLVGEETLIKKETDEENQPQQEKEKIQLTTEKQENNNNQGLSNNCNC